MVLLVRRAIRDRLRVEGDDVREITGCKPSAFLDAECRRRQRGQLPDRFLDGNDVFRLRDEAAAAVAKLRAGEGPQFIEAATYRWREHVGPGQDYHLGYRDKTECAAWEETDAVRALGEQLGSVERQLIEAAVEREVADAFSFAESSPFPAAAELMTDIFTEEADALAGR